MTVEKTPFHIFWQRCTLTDGGNSGGLCTGPKETLYPCIDWFTRRENVVGERGDMHHLNPSQRQRLLP